MSITLSNRMAAEMAETIRGLMCHWHPNSQGCDYRCEFCGQEAKTNTDHTINHRNDCDGVKYLNILLPQCDAESIDDGWKCCKNADHEGDHETAGGYTFSGRRNLIGPKCSHCKEPGHLGIDCLERYNGY